METGQERRGQVWMDDRRREAAGGVEHAVSHICMRVLAQEEQTVTPNWSQTQNCKLLAREAIRS